MSQPAPTQARRLASILLEAAVVTQEQIEAALVRQRSSGRRIGATLVELGAATEEDIGWALARQLGHPFVDLRPEALDRELIRSFPEGLLQRVDAVPLVNQGATISVAMADPTDAEVVAELERAAGRPLTPAVATPTAIRRVLDEVLGCALSRRPGRSDTAASTEDPRDRSGATLLASHVQRARIAGASEIHFVSREDSTVVQHRVRGRLETVGQEPRAAAESLIARIATLNGPVLVEGKAHAAGSVVCPLGTENARIAVSILRFGGGTSVTLSLSTETGRAPALEDLGLDPVDLSRLRATLDGSAGLGIVSGPPRGGVSTTLAALLAQVDTPSRRGLVFGPASSHVPAAWRAVEDPIAAASAWRGASSGQCADVVALDGVLSGAGVEEALAPEAFGRFVLVGTDWLDTFALLEDLSRRAGSRSALAARLRFVVQQRLLVCEERGAGATHAAPCPVFEVLVVGDRLRDAIRSGAGAATLHAAAEADGFVPLSASLRGLVARGVVTADLAARALA